MNELHDDIIPAGSELPPDEDKAVEQPEVEVAQAPPAPEPEEIIPEKFKGKDAKDIAASYVQLEERLGRQGQEVGQLRQMNMQLQNQLQTVQSQINQSSRTAQPGFEDQLNEVAKAVESGDLPIGEAMKRVATLSARVATDTAVKTANKNFQEAQQDQEARQIKKDFLKNNPDFDEVVASGMLEQIKGPEDDNLSAYWKFKAMDTAKKSEEAAKAAYDKGRKEISDLKDGTQIASKVLSKPGTEVRQVNKSSKPLNDAELRQEMMTALQQHRAGTG